MFQLMPKDQKESLHTRSDPTYKCISMMYHHMCATFQAIRLSSVFIHVQTLFLIFCTCFLSSLGYCHTSQTVIYRSAGMVMTLPPKSKLIFNPQSSNRGSDWPVVAPWSFTDGERDRVRLSFSLNAAIPGKHQIFSLIIQILLVLGQFTSS